MSSYLANFEPRDDDAESYISEAERASVSSAESLDELGDFAKNLEQQLIDERLNLVLSFNKSLISVDNFFSELSRIKHELESLNEVNDNIDEELIENESKLMSILDTYIRKIKDQLKINKEDKSIKIDLVKYLTPEEVRVVQDLNERINFLRNKYKSIHEDENEPYQSFMFESIYSSMNELEKEQLRKSAKNRGIKIPEQSDFVSLEDYRNAEEDFYEKFKMFIDPDFFEKFLDKEQTEIENLAKKLHIYKPKIGEFNTPEEYQIATTAFYRDVSKLLPGYVYKMNITSIGGSYELVNDQSIMEKMKEEIELFKKLPIQLSDEDAIRIKTNKLLSNILSNLNDPYLINCIMSTNPKLPYVEKIPLKQIVPKIQKLVLRREGTSLKNVSLIPTLEGISKNDYQKILKAKRILLVELLDRKKTIKTKYTPGTSLPSNSIPLITQKLRNQNKLEIFTILNIVPEPELRLNTNDIVVKLEEYIYLITNGNYLEYKSKISDIIFILKNYKNFRTNVLNGNINIYQLVLFEKEIYYEAKAHIFPTNIKTRKYVLKTIKQILQDAAKDQNLIIQNSYILTNFIINYKSKKLELLVFDTASKERKYDEIAKKLIKTLTIDVSIGYITNNISIEQILQSTTNNISIQAVMDYNDFTISEIEALMSQEQENINILKKNQRKLEAINYSGEFIALWNPSPQIVDNIDINRWNKLKIKNNINKLKEFRSVLMKKYRLEIDPQLGNVINMLSIAENKLKMFQKSRILKIGEQSSIYKIRYINFLKEKYGKVPLPSRPSIKYFINYSLIFELVQSYKRKLMVASTKSSTNKLIELFEFIDLNKLNQREGYITDLVFDKLNKKFLIDVGNLIPIDYKSLDNLYFKQAINILLDFFNLSSENLNTLTQKIELLVENWPKVYTSQDKIVDYYGTDLFLKLANINEPIDFYDQKFVRVYNGIVSTNTPFKQEIYKRPQILYNPETGKWGNEAFNGQIYDVHKLDRNPSTKMPIDQTKIVMEKEPRTGTYVPITKTVQKVGKYPFILVQIRTTKEGLFDYMWIEAPISAVKMYPLKYDSCSRFLKEPECNTGIGLYNKQCVFDYNICKST